MLPGERLRNWVDETAAGFADRLSEWLGKVVNRGTEKIVDRFEPEGVNASRAFITRLRNMPGVPPELQADIDRMIEPTGLWGLVAAIVLVPLILIPMIFAVFQPVARLLNYAEERIFHSGRMDPTTAIRAFWRGIMPEDRMRDTLLDHGLDETDIDALIAVTKFYPAPADLVNWQAKEVFEPRMREKYGLAAELGELEREPFHKAGMTDDQIDNFWMAHWQHPELRTVIEMLRRTDFSEEDMEEWFRLVEIPPYWRQKLIDISYEVPTRVDVRRWWDMRTISQERLREIYRHQGYHGEDLDDYVRWTMVYTDFPMMITRWKNGWITEQAVRDWLATLDIPAERIDHFIEEKLKADQPERTTKERDITKTDIIKGVKQNVITRAEGVELLVDMGYSEDEADYILEINIPLDEEEETVALRQLSKSDILKGLKTEVLTRAEALGKLREIRYSSRDAELLLVIFEAAIKPPVEPNLREASKADVIAGVKKGLLTQEEAYLMLQAIGFTPEASEFIIEVRTEESPFSPRSLAEFKDRSGKYRRAAGMEVSEMPDELKAAAAQVVELTREVEDLDRSVTAEERLMVKAEIVPEAAREKLTELQVTRNRAVAELERVKAEYDRLVAEWKHSSQAAP